MDISLILPLQLKLKSTVRQKLMCRPNAFRQGLSNYERKQICLLPKLLPSKKFYDLRFIMQKLPKNFFLTITIMVLC